MYHSDDPNNKLFFFLITMFKERMSKKVTISFVLTMIIFVISVIIDSMFLENPYEISIMRAARHTSTFGLISLRWVRRFLR